MPLGAKENRKVYFTIPRMRKRAYLHNLCSNILCKFIILLASHAVLVIAGTTSVGKTDLSLELVKLLDAEVISADSAQVG